MVDGVVPRDDYPPGQDIAQAEEGSESDANIPLPVGRREPRPLEEESEEEEENEEEQEPRAEPRLHAVERPPSYLPTVHLTQRINHLIEKEGAAPLAGLIANPKFRSYREQLNWLPQLKTYQEHGSADQMVDRVKLMLQNVECVNNAFGLLQHIEIGRQLHVISERENVHVYSLVKGMCDDGARRVPQLKLTTAQNILRVTWAVYKYPVLSQVQMLWNSAKDLFPTIVEYLDKQDLAFEHLPENILGAQADRASYYIRVSLTYPTQHLGDGDGLPLLHVHRIHGLYVNEQLCIDQQLQATFRQDLGELYDAQRDQTEMRSRILGADTQETPKTGDEAMGVQQRHWEQGRQVLVSELTRLLGNIPINDAMILVDVFGIDLYHRLILDIREVYDKNAVREPTPSIGRFQIAHQLLASGYAFPTNSYYTDRRLLRAFQEARTQRLGCFGEDPRNVVHPLLCRRARYEAAMRKGHRRRSRYLE